MNNKIPSFLVIDDDRASLLLVKATLSQQQFNNVDLCWEPQDAHKYYQNKNYDILILDLRMPHVSGFDILAQLQKAKTPTPDVIVITADADSKHNAKALQLGAKKVFLKPYNVKEFLQEINRLLQARNNLPGSKLKL